LVVVWSFSWSSSFWCGNNVTGVVVASGAGVWVRLPLGGEMAIDLVKDDSKELARKELEEADGAVEETVGVSGSL
jgi:hypothetical protein